MDFAAEELALIRYYENLKLSIVRSLENAGWKAVSVSSICFTREPVRCSYAEVSSSFFCVEKEDRDMVDLPETRRFNFLHVIGLSARVTPFIWSEKTSTGNDIFEASQMNEEEEDEFYSNLSRLRV